MHVTYKVANRNHIKKLYSLFTHWYMYQVKHYACWPSNVNGTSACRRYKVYSVHAKSTLRPLTNNEVSSLRYRKPITTVTKSLLQLHVIHFARLDQTANASSLFPLGLARLLRGNFSIFREQLSVVSSRKFFQLNQEIA
jgi:hypothetical protein